MLLMQTRQKTLGPYPYTNMEASNLVTLNLRPNRVCYTFRGQLNEKPSIIPGCPGAADALACTQTSKFQSLLLAPLHNKAIILNQIHMC